MNIGKQIKTLRLAKGVTQEELAEYLGVSFQAVSKWETQTSTPDITLLPNIAIFFGITIDELFQIPNEAEFERIENMFWHERRINSETFHHCVQFLEHVLQDDPKNVRAYICLAYLYNHRAKSDHELASEYAKKVLAINPSEKAGWVAYLEANNGVCGDEWYDNHFEVISYFKEFLKINPDNTLGLYGIIENLLDDDRYEEAVPYIERIRIAAKNYQYEIYMGDVMLGKGQLKEAETYWNAAVAHFPEAWQVYCCRADRLKKLGKYHEALADYENCFLIQKPPRITDGLHSMAQLHELLGDYTAAINDRERLIKCLQEEYNTFSGEGINSQKREIARLKKYLSKSSCF